MIKTKRIPQQFFSKKERDEFKAIILTFLGIVFIGALLLMTTAPKELILWSSFVAAVIVPAIVLYWTEKRKKRPVTIKLNSASELLVSSQSIISHTIALVNPLASQYPQNKDANYLETLSRQMTSKGSSLQTKNSWLYMDKQKTNVAICNTNLSNSLYGQFYTKKTFKDFNPPRTTKDIFILSIW